MTAVRLDLALLAMLAAACSGAPQSAAPAASAAPARSDARPDIVIFLLDTVRADHLPAYGYPKRTMPFLSLIAEESVVFERAWAPSSWTPTSMASIFTGLWANQHGVLTGFRATQRALRDGADDIELNRVPEAAELLPEVLKRAGYRTYGAADNINMGPAMGFTRGFDRFYGRPDGGVRGRVRDWKQELKQGQAPFFLYLHYMDAHGPFKVDPDPGQSVIDATVEAYDAALLSLDEKIRFTFGTLGLRRPGVVALFLADHGEEFLEHGGTGHGVKLYEELLRVPLIVYAPGRLEPRRVAAPVSSIDVLPTLRELVGAQPGERDAGVSLLATLRGEVKEPRTFFPMRFWKPMNVRLARKAVVHGRHKYIVEQPVNREELYDLEADPGETHNLAAAEPALVAELRERLRRFERSAPSYPREFAAKVPITRDQAEELKALGYVQ